MNNFWSKIIKKFLNCFLLSYLIFQPLMVYSHTQELQAPLFNNLGSYHYKISTNNSLAQRFFDQGLILFYSFEWGEAARSFQEATRLDPKCAMCFWGLALALKNKINAPQNHDNEKSSLAIKKAQNLQKFATSKERAFIKALALFFEDKSNSIDKSANFGCHSSKYQTENFTKKEITNYSNAMQKLVKQYPEDIDAKAIYSYALFNKASWKFWDAQNKINPITPKLIKTLKEILAKDPMHVGGNHYYIHVIEQSPYPQKAILSAKRLKTLVPGAEHLVHMPSHIYFRTGDYQKASQANLQAIAVFKEYNKFCKEHGFKPEVNYLYFHNFDFLRSSASMQGQKNLALKVAKEIIAEPFPTWLKHENNLEWFIPIPYFIKARFGMWKNLLNEPMPNVSYKYALGMWYYVRSLALIHTNNIKLARINFLKLENIIQQKNIKDKMGPASLELLKIADEILKGLFADKEGNKQLAIMHLKKANLLQNAMGYHEPPDWYFQLTEMLGYTYLKYGNYPAAINAFNKSLKQYPKNGWALYGLAQALRELGKDDLADKAEKEFKKAWQNADILKPVS